MLDSVILCMFYNEKYRSHARKTECTELPCMSQYFLDLFVVLQSHGGGGIITVEKV